MVYVTHDQTEALTMSNRIAVFDDGIIQQLCQSRNDLYELPEECLRRRSSSARTTSLVGDVVETEGDL